MTIAEYNEGLREIIAKSHNSINLLNEVYFKEIGDCRVGSFIRHKSMNKIFQVSKVGADAISWDYKNEGISLYSIPSISLYGFEYNEKSKKIGTKEKFLDFWDIEPVSEEETLGIKSNLNLLQLHSIKLRRETDPLFKLQFTLGKRMDFAFKKRGWDKPNSNIELLGVSYSVVKKHIERQFTKDMEWDNHGKWHIDHIIPLCAAKDCKELQDLCHYTNLQPLWAKENMRKNKTIPMVQKNLAI